MVNTSGKAVSASIPLALSLLAICFAQNSPDGPKLSWSTSLSLALQESKRTGKPVFVDFWAIWCTYCEDLEKTLETDPFRRQLTGFVLARVDFDTEREWANQYAIRTLPTTLILGEQGEVLMRSVGRTPDRVLFRRVSTALSGYSLYLEEREISDDPEVLNRRGNYLLYSGNPSAALTLFERLYLQASDVSRTDRERYRYSMGLSLLADRSYPQARVVFEELQNTGSSEQIREGAAEALSRISELQRQPPFPGTDTRRR